MSMKPRLLYIASRWPWPVSTGRQRMIDQELRFAAAEYDIVLAAFGSGEASDIPSDVVSRTITLTLPRWPEILLNLLLLRCGSLQECLYRSQDSQQEVARLVRALAPDIVMFDMVRTAQYGENAALFPPDCRRVLDMDDLLSDRYRQMRQGGGGSALGMFSHRFGRPIAWIGQVLPRLLFTLESRLMARRERAISQRFDMVFLVSHREAQTLRQRTGAGNIRSVPPAVEDFPMPAVYPNIKPAFHFLGSARYAPNAEALRFLDAAGRHLVTIGFPVDFNAFGASDDALSFDHIRQAGFLDSLGAHFTPGMVMVAPILTGTGVKTKVLEAMGRAVAVITTTKGIEGLAVEPGVHLLVGDDPETFAQHVKTLGQDPALTAQLAQAGFDYARANHSEAKLKLAFLDNLAAAKRGPPASSAPVGAGTPDIGAATSRQGFRARGVTG